MKQVCLHNTFFAKDRLSLVSGLGYCPTSSWNHLGNQITIPDQINGQLTGWLFADDNDYEHNDHNNDDDHR